MEPEHRGPVAVLLNVAFQWKDCLQECDFGWTSSNAECHGDHHKLLFRLLTAAKKSRHAIFPFLFRGAHWEEGVCFETQELTEVLNWPLLWERLKGRRSDTAAQLTCTITRTASAEGDILKYSVLRSALILRGSEVKVQKQILNHDIGHKEWCKDSFSFQNLSKKQTKNLLKLQGYERSQCPQHMRTPKPLPTLMSKV